MTSSKTAKILIVDDDPGHLASVKMIVRSWGYTVEIAEDGDVAVDMVKSGPVDLILMDVRMTNMSGIEALQEIKAYNPAIPVIIMTAYSSVGSAVDALKSGAYDYLIKPLDFEVLKLTIERASEHAGLKEEIRALKTHLREDYDMANIIGRSPSMTKLLEMMSMIAPSEATVLITGESGTGKELIARSLHFNSPRREKPLVVVNCAAITETLLESELFGHEKGAFTGADKRREGRFKQADSGTVFLDEIGEMSPTMQAKLLRVLQEREIQRVGGEETMQVDVRVIAATNRDLVAEVARGRFREDLFYRLNVMPLNVPPLRERQEDIPLLAQHFMEKFAEKNRRAVKGFVPLAMDMLVNYEWPGNVRELENAVERAVILLTGEYITEQQLPLNITETYPGPTQAQSPEVKVTDGSRPLEEIEKEAILETLKASGGNKAEAARRLGITRKTLHNKLKHYDLF
ncbi:MAG: sigma 54-interacting transcriptional regulator [Deltaproteobacteria bacterium]|jgi:two-component system, NtrC family, response regulator HydG|nr:sigma 54-interacting transcriptional regulator [Deltaproteobacteria bacterium]